MSEIRDKVSIGRCSHCHRQVEIVFVEENCEMVFDLVALGEAGDEAFYRVGKHPLGTIVCPGSGNWPAPNSMED